MVLVSRVDMDGWMEGRERWRVLKLSIGNGLKADSPLSLSC